MKPQHIYWFTYFDTSEATVRYRAVYFLQHAEKQHGINFNFVYPSYKLEHVFNFLKVYFEVLLFRKPNSIIVIQKLYSRGIYASLLKILVLIRRRYTVYDIDDAEYTRRNDSTIKFFLRNTNIAITGSMSLVQYAHSLKAKSMLITSPVIHHEQKKLYRNEVLTIGWVGYYSAHKISLLQLLFPALLSINTKIRLILMGVRSAFELLEIENYFKANSNIEVIADLNINWLNEKEIYKYIAQFDIGVSPLIENEFNSAKSAFKLKQYLSCGIPVIASNVGENSRFIKNGMNGYLADSAQDFRERILLIHSMSNDAYFTMSKNAESTFPEFSLENYTQSYLSIFL